MKPMPSVSQIPISSNYAISIHNDFNEGNEGILTLNPYTNQCVKKYTHDFYIGKRVAGEIANIAFIMTKS